MGSETIVVGQADESSDGLTLLNTSEAAKVLRSSRSKLIRLVRSGELPSYKVGATYVFYLRDLHEFVRRNAVGKATGAAQTESLI